MHATAYHRLPPPAFSHLAHIRNENKSLHDCRCAVRIKEDSSLQSLLHWSNCRAHWEPTINTNISMDANFWNSHFRHLLSASTVPIICIISNNNQENHKNHAQEPRAEMTMHNRHIINKHNIFTFQNDAFTAVTK